MLLIMSHTPTTRLRPLWFVPAAPTAVLVTCAWVLAGCGTSVKMMPTPVVFEGGRINLFAELPPPERTTSLDVFYATDRTGSGPADNRRYGNGVDSKLKLGTATVRFGGGGETWDELVRASLAADR